MMFEHDIHIRSEFVVVHPAGLLRQPLVFQPSSLGFKELVEHLRIVVVFQDVDKFAFHHVVVELQDETRGSSLAPSPPLLLQR